MRNLKRVLSLALALVMVLGMMVIGTSAATFTDAAEINPAYEEAVAVLNGVGLFQGNDDGTLAPKQELNRAMAATIMARIMLGSAYENLSDDTARQIFSDVPAGEWYSAEVEYCYNNQLIGGHGDGTFDPEGELTGIAFAKLLLVAMGYNAETEGYTGPNWATGIYADAVDNGLDLVGVDMAGALTREQAAQMIFQALEAETVKYNNLEKGAFADGNTFMGKWYPKLSKFEGVVTANEYANLYSYYALRSGKTTIDGVTYNLSTEITDIGESRQGWAYGKDVIFVEDTGYNTVVSTGEAAELNYKWQLTNGMYLAGAEYFVNFDNAYDGYYTSDWRIAYGADPAGTLEVIKAGDKIYADEFAVLQSIFNEDDDEYQGWVVYVGTQRDEDISDVLSFKQFVAKYLDAGKVLSTSVSENENGNWMKVIDNDGDYYADYVLKTEFTMTEVTKLSSKGVLTLDGVTYGGLYDDCTYATSADLAKGDVVLYTIIDGVCYVELAPTFTGEVDKYTYADETLTVEGEDYVQSGIDAHMNDYLYGLENADKKTEYTYFMDWFNNIVVYAEPTFGAGDLVLLTDGYYETGRNGYEYAVKAYVDGEIVVKDVNGSKNYSDIDEFFEYDGYDSNDWKKLQEFWYDYAWTNLARYTEYNGKWDLQTADTYSYYPNGAVKAIKTNYIDLDETAFKSGATAMPYGNGTDNVQLNKNTVFYYVTKVNGKLVIDTVVGYKNTIGVDNDIVDIHAMYAVATNTNADSNKAPYWVADVVVIETNSPAFELSNDVALGYWVVNKTVNDFAGLNVIDNTAALDTLNVISLEGDEYDDFLSSYINVPAFYFNSEDADEDSYIIEITENFGKYGIFAVTGDRVNALHEYMVTTDGTDLDYDDETVIYTVDWNLYNTKIVASTEDADGDALKLTAGKDYIVYATKGYVVYAIEVTEETEALWDAIYADANPAPETPEVKGNLYSVKVLGKEVESEDGINYVAYVCSEATSITEGKRLEVKDNYTGAKMELWNKDKTEKIGDQTGTGSIADDGQAVSSETKWIVISDGIEYTITVVVQDHDLELTSKDEDKVVIFDNTIYVASTFMNETNWSAAALYANLNWTGKLSGVDETFTLTSECGHTKIFTLAFVEGDSDFFA